MVIFHSYVNVYQAGSSASFNCCDGNISPRWVIPPWFFSRAWFSLLKGAGEIPNFLYWTSDPELGEESNYPLVNIQKAMENHHAINGKIHYKWSFSIAMLVHQRVRDTTKPSKAFLPMGFSVKLFFWNRSMDWNWMGRFGWFSHGMVPPTFLADTDFSISFGLAFPYSGLSSPLLNDTPLLHCWWHDEIDK